MDLYVRDRGEGEAIVFLHGLFGSADNLGMISRPMEEAGYRTISFDLRNHGRSPHAPGMEYSGLAQDVTHMLDKLEIDKAHFYGHSMGGKTSMTIALNHSDRVRSLTVGDIAPVQYEHGHSDVFAAMLAVRAAGQVSRPEAEAIVREHIEEPAVQSFIMTNWRRLDSGEYGWRLGLDHIMADYDPIIAGQDGGPYNGPVLFLKGGDSPYITSEYRAHILKLFPAATVRIIEKTGHWFHAEKPDTTVRLYKRFLDSLD